MHHVARTLTLVRNLFLDLCSFTRGDRLGARLHRPPLIPILHLVQPFHNLRSIRVGGWIVLASHVHYPMDGLHWSRIVARCQYDRYRISRSDLDHLISIIFNYLRTRALLRGLARRGRPRPFYFYSLLVVSVQRDQPRFLRSLFVVLSTNQRNDNWIRGVAFGELLFFFEICRYIFLLKILSFDNNFDFYRYVTFWSANEMILTRSFSLYCGRCMINY